MILRRPVRRERRGEVALEAEIVPSGAEPWTAALAVAADYGGYIDDSATPFVPVATALATGLGEDLTIEGPVSTRIVEGARAASRMYSEWWSYRAASVIAEEAVAAQARGASGVGLFYSRGVDSSATLLRSLEGTIDERVTHLLSFEGLSRIHSEQTMREIWLATERAGAEFGLPVVRLATNTDELVRKGMAWVEGFGAVLAGGALAVGPMLSDALYGATVDDEHPRARGSHPELDRLWSTETTEFRQDGTELGKMGRIALVGGSPVALRHLKVCWEADTASNCGRCFKCLKTMCALARDGGTSWQVAFEAPLSAESILVVAIPPSDRIKVSQQIAGNLPPELGHLEVAWVRRVDELDRRDAAEHRTRVRRRRRRQARRRALRRARRARARTARRMRRSMRLARRRLGAALGR